MFSPYEFISLIICVTAILSYLNYKILKLPETIGLLLLSLFSGLAILLLGDGAGLEKIRAALAALNFNKTLLQGMLSILLFAGALEVNIRHLRRHVCSISVLATFGVILSASTIGFGTYGLLHLLGISLSLFQCFLFGALVSPTDPVSVLAMLDKTSVPDHIKALLAGEALFNDGTGIILFSILSDIVVSNHATSAGLVAQAAAVTVGGGLMAGVLSGGILILLLGTLDNYRVEILLTLGIIVGSYAIAHRLHFSGPLAIVVAGIIVGNYGRKSAMSQNTRRELDAFWSILDWIVNAILFVLIGVYVVLVPDSSNIPVIVIASTVILFLSRWLTVSISGTVFRLRDLRSAEIRKFLLFGGLRGGISIALALSIPATVQSNVIIVMTYTAVIVSVIVQGLLFKNIFGGSGSVRSSDLVVDGREL